ncbi:MAG: endonuclease/exonuclease/phosphatase family protein [Ginsengibacter sp.]
MYYQKSVVYRKILVVITVLIMVAYVSVCLVPFVNTSENWFIAVPGIIFPLLFFLLLILMVVWAFLKQRWVWGCMIALICGIQQIMAVFSFHFPHDFSTAKEPNTLRVMQWNVMGWDQDEDQGNVEDGGDTYRPVMMSSVKGQDADVLCFDEFFEPKDTTFSKSNIASITAMGYPYHFFSPTKNYRNDSTSGVIIFSKYPRINSGEFDLDRNKRGDHLIFMDIKVKGTVFRIFATHLIAINFAQWDDGQEDRSVKDYGWIVSKLIKGYEYRYYQAEFVQQKIAESPYPAVLCGDFNDIPNSSTYFKMKGNLQDPFLEKGYWTGRTTRQSFLFISPRIDYIFADKKLKVLQFQTLHIPYSDHFPVLADLQY